MEKFYADEEALNRRVATLPAKQKASADRERSVIEILDGDRPEKKTARGDLQLAENEAGTTAGRGVVEATDELDQVNITRPGLHR